jgi:putative toxin-antitoxin system antitoxin component (TIGR02293 family)
MLNDVLGYGRDVFGDKGNFNEWLRTPSEALGNVTPLSLMDTLYGIDEVKKEIGRIAYGVY